MTIEIQRIDTEETYEAYRRKLKQAALFVGQNDITDLREGEFQAFLRIHSDLTDELDTLIGLIAEELE